MFRFFKNMFVTIKILYFMSLKRFLCKDLYSSSDRSLRFRNRLDYDVKINFFQTNMNYTKNKYPN